MESGSVRRRKVWYIAKFENMFIWKFDTHGILSRIGFVDYQSKVFSIMRCWMIIIILDLSVTFRKLSRKLTY